MKICNISKEEAISILNETKLYQSLPPNVDYSFQEAIKSKKEILSPNSSLMFTNHQIKLILKTITNKFQKELNLPKTALFFINPKKEYGHFYKNSISISIKLINNLKNKTISLKEKVELIVSILHEISHQYVRDDNTLINYTKYMITKEDYLDAVITNFYKNNYVNLADEINARIESYNMMSKFF